MVTSVVAVQTAPAASNGSAKKDAQLLDKLVKLWATDNKRSLEIRLETGNLLNASLGQPTQRQPRGRAVLKQAAKALQIAESELNRMRWFAYFSKDEKSCWGDTPPTSRSWTQFKAILPKLLATLKGNEKRQRSSGENKSNAVVDSLLRHLSSATSKLRANNFTVDGAKRKELIVGLQDLVSAVSKTCGVRFHVEAEEASGDQGLTEALAVSGCENSPNLSPCPMDTVTV